MKPARLQASLLRDFCDRAVSYIKQTFPDATRSSDATELRRLVNEAVKRSARYGFQTEPEVVAFATDKLSSHTPAGDFAEAARRVVDRAARDPTILSMYLSDGGHRLYFCDDPEEAAAERRRSAADTVQQRQNLVVRPHHHNTPYLLCRRQQPVLHREWRHDSVPAYALGHR